MRFLEQARWEWFSEYWCSLSTAVLRANLNRMFNNGWRRPSPAMVDYLDRIGAGLVLENPERFSYDYIPPALVGRDEEQGTLASMMSAVITPGGSGRAIITGKVGSGKSVMAKRFCEDVSRRFTDRRDIRYVHINCRNSSSAAQVLHRIVQALDEGHPDRGLSSGEILTSMRRLLNSSNSHLIVVLDEVNHLMRKAGDDIIYQLLRIDEDQQRQGTLSLMLISQEQILDLFENAVISRFGRSNHLRLEPYDVEGLYSIAEQRAGLALVEGSYSEGVLHLVAQAAEGAGDARLAIELLEGAAKRAEAKGRSEIVSEDVQTVSNMQPNQIDSSSIKELTPHAMLVLLAICRRLKNVEEIATGDVGQLYRVVCEEFETDPKGHTTLWKNLKTLQEEGIISARSATVKQGRGRTQFFSMPQTLPADMAGRLESLIPAQLRR